MAKIPPQPLQRAEDLAVPAGGGPPHGRGTAGRNDRLERLAWLPIAVLFGAMVVLWVAGPRTEYPSPALMMALNFLTRTVASLVVVALAGRSFLIRRTPGLLLLGSGVAIWGAAGLVTTAVVAREANLGITISNLGLWLSAICHLAGAVLSVRSARTVGPADLWLAAGVTLALGAVGLVTLATFEGWLPVFFVQGEGGTVVRHLVLTSAIGMFVLAALLLHVNHPASSSFARWYAFALLLIAAGVFGMLVQSVRNSALDWVCRAAQYLGGVYMLVAAFAAMRESGGRWITLEQVRGQARYRYGMAAAVVIAAGATRLAFPVLGERYPFVPV